MISKDLQKIQDACLENKILMEIYFEITDSRPCGKYTISDFVESDVTIFRLMNILDINNQKTIGDWISVNKGLIKNACLQIYPTAGSRASPALVYMLGILCMKSDKISAETLVGAGWCSEFAHPFYEEFKKINPPFGDSDGVEVE